MNSAHQSFLEMQFFLKNQLLAILFGGELLIGWTQFVFQKLVKH